MKIAQKTSLRLKNMLKQDKEKISLPLLSLMKSDIFQIVSNYFELRLEDMNICYFVDADGKYQIEIKLMSKRVKKANFLSI
ncbi:MAG: hypothetical protein EOM55_03550 [Clostridia bacterium]|nr:hypothetical protein [Clostridia bacterium]